MFLQNLEVMLYNVLPHTDRLSPLRKGSVGASIVKNRQRRES